MDRIRLNRWHARVRLVLVVAGCALIVLGFGGLNHAAAHAELERADPPPDGLLAAPPQRVDLWFTERIDVGAGSPSLRLLDDAGRDVTVRNLEGDPTDPRHVRADVAGIATGTYTVVWSARSADDGHILSGTYAFRVGTGGPPGAATVQGERPRAWAVATRWLTFLGAALAAAGFAFPRFVLSGRSDDAAGRRLIIVAAGAAVALVATLAEPVLLTRWPPAGALAPDLTEALAGLPRAWWLRPAGLLPALILAVVLMRGWHRGRGGIAAAVWAGFPLSLVALLGLSLTGHGAAREHWRALAIASDTLHQWAVGLWVGGLVHLALTWSAVRSSPDSNLETDALAANPLRRFSRLALGLVVVGIGSGVLNAGLVLPTLRSLWSSTYGDVILLKVAALVPPLALATFHRAALRRAMGHAQRALRTTVRLEAGLVLLVVLGGSVLALLAPPVVRSVSPLDLAAPTDDGALIVHLILQPGKSGTNTMTVRVADAAGTPITPEQIALVRLEAKSLDYGVDAEPIDVPADTTGGFAVRSTQLSLDGWWRVAVMVRRLGVPDVQVPFYLRLPDPNVNGFDSVPVPPSSDEARAVFERGLVGLTSLHRVRFGIRLTGGTGTVSVLDQAVSDGSDGRPPAMITTSNQLTVVRVGDREWVKRPDGTWDAREAGPFIPPSMWGEDYIGATGFRLGAVEEVDGEQGQIVTFFVPGTPQRVAAWYAWWVGVDSGRIRRWAMVSRSHYMLKEYRDFDVPFAIEPPV